LASAKQDKLESGATVRIDSTVTAALMHEPSDSALLWDAVRVMTRLLRQAAALPGAPALQWRDRRRLAKKRARAIEYSRGKANRRRLYCELMAATPPPWRRCRRPVSGWPTSPASRPSAGAPSSATISR
jgi:IS5 family transposase